MSFVANTGQMAIEFNEEGVNSSGSLTKSLRRPNEMTSARAKAVSTILGMADSKGEPVGVIVNKVLSQSIPELQSYVQARGEAPATDPVKLAVQAALLRATEIALVSKSIDTTDEDALLIIEDSEQQHVDDNTNDTSSILSPQTAAGLALLVKRISDRMKNNTGSGKLCDFVYALRNATGVNNFSDVSHRAVADNYDDTDPNYDYGDYDPNDINYIGGPNAEPQVGSGTSSGSFWDNLFNNIDKIVDGVTKVSGAINTTVGNVQNTSGGILNQINQIGGGIGAASIDQYLKENWLKVVGIILALVIITIIIARASRSN